jgi:hypothetical protein
MKKAITILLVGALVVVNSCQDGSNSEDDSMSVQHTRTAEEVNESLNQLAQLLALSLDDEEIGNLIKYEVGQQITGDFEALFNDVATKTIEGTTDKLITRLLDVSCVR